MLSTEPKIFVLSFNGSMSCVSVNARHVGKNSYEILNNSEYTDNNEAMCFYEFYPGDIVELSTHTLYDGTMGLRAFKLIKEGHWRDRKFNIFKFNATLHGLTINRRTAENFKEEIKRVINQNINGNNFYPDLLKTVNKLHKLLSND
jgi:hypothetical protein